MLLWFSAECSLLLLQIVVIFLINSVACLCFENGLLPYFQTMSSVVKNPWRAPLMWKMSKIQTRKFDGYVMWKVSMEALYLITVECFNFE